MTRPEIELLLSCARTHMDSEAATRVRVLLLRGEINWGQLIHLARQHALIPLLYRHIKTICPEAVPGVYMKQLRDSSRRNTARNLFLVGELCRLLRLFEERGIPTVPYKGPTLAIRAYGNPALRQFNDLDFLVHQRDVFKAAELLSSQGYHRQQHFTQTQEAVYLKFGCEHYYVRSDKRVALEIHWEFAPRYFSLTLDSARLWQRLDRVNICGREVRSLSLEDLLIVLCVNGSKKLWQRLGLISDLAALISNKVNWPQLIHEASAAGARRMLFLGLFLAHDLLSAPVPQQVLREVQADTAVIALASQVKELLFRPVSKPVGFKQGCLFQLQARERLRDRFRYCFRLAATPTQGDWAFAPLPDRLSFLYYLIRPIRLVKEYGLHL